MSEERKNNRKVISKGILTLKNNNDVLWDLKIYIDMVKIAQNRRGDLELKRIAFRYTITSECLVKTMI